MHPTAEVAEDVHSHDETSVRLNASVLIGRCRAKRLAILR